MAFQWRLGEYGGSYLFDTFEFIPNYTTMGVLDTNVIKTDLYILERNRPPELWYLGQINYSGDYQFTWSYLNNGFFNNNSFTLAIEDGGDDVYVYSYDISYDRCYRLTFIVDETYYYDYYFLFKPLGSTGGLVLNASGDYVYSDEVNVEPPTTDEYVAGIYDSFKGFSSGVITSGDIYSPSWYLEDPDEPFYNYLYQSLSNAITYSGDAFITIPLLEGTENENLLIIRASDFYWNIPVVTNVLHLFYYCGFIFVIIKLTIRITEYINTLDLKKFEGSLNDLKDWL